MCLEHDDPNGQLCYPLGPDLLVSQNLPTHLNADEDEGWAPFFFPKDFVKENFGITTENFQLGDDKLFQLGQ